MLGLPISLLACHAKGADSAPQVLASILAPKINTFVVKDTSAPSTQKILHATLVPQERLVPQQGFLKSHNAPFVRQVSFAPLLQAIHYHVL